MTDLEKVEKLREKADVSFAEAKDALDKSGGDVLDALIYLEAQGKAIAPVGGGFYSGSGSYSEQQQYTSHGDSGAERKSETFSDVMRRFGRYCLKIFNKGNTNFLDATKNDQLMFSCPVTALVVLLLFFFWLILPLYVISLFLGFSYRFRGEDLGRESVNAVMDGASNVVDDVKKSFADRNTGAKNSDGTGGTHNGEGG